MNRPALIALRVLAIGSALSVLGCLVVNRQKQATAASGDPGSLGPIGPPAPGQVRPGWASSSKSLSALVKEEDVSSPINYGEPIRATAAPMNVPSEVILGTKSAAPI